MTTRARDEVISLDGASLSRGDRTIWQDLTIKIMQGEFIAILGTNGAGKTTLLKTLLGLIPLSSGSVQVLGGTPKRGSQQIGYIPQQKSFDSLLPVRGRDLVKLGASGHRYGFGRLPLLDRRTDEVIKQVGATDYADKPIGLLSGGEQQRLRIAQALISEPQLLFCDEPLLSLDVVSQASVVKLIDQYRRKMNAAVLFVTHEINPIIGLVDRVLYLANGRWVMDTPDKVLSTETLSQLFGAAVEVVNIKDNILVVGADGTSLHHGEHH